MPSEAPAAAALLETRSLTKEFRGFKAVSDVSLGVAEGTVHALVGPNGAGKTTMLRILATAQLCQRTGGAEARG